MELRTERVLIETERHVITGVVSLPREGFRSRLSDFLSSSERDFIAVRDAVVTPVGDPQGGVEREFVAVARGHIVLASPLEGSPDAGDRPGG